MQSYASEDLIKNARDTDRHLGTAPGGWRTGMFSTDSRWPHSGVAMIALT